MIVEGRITGFIPQMKGKAIGCDAGNSDAERHADDDVLPKQL
jgi:hypothetical protein